MIKETQRDQGHRARPDPGGPANRTLRSAGTALVALALLAAGPSAAAGPPTSASVADRCSDLVGTQVPVDGGSATVETAVVVAAGATAPEHYDVAGTIDPQIRFQSRLPTAAWNGKYFQAGCGGFCGAVHIASCGEALGRGYAVAAEDSGHAGFGGDGSWALDDRQAEVDWGHRSPHVMAQAGKALVERFYGQVPTYSYFQGCSTGGRQALSEAQRYPDDFDGIVAGAPALYQNYLAILSQASWRP